MSVQLINCPPSSGLASAAATNFTAPNSYTVWTTTEANGEMIWRVTGVFKNLVVYMASAPGSGKSIAYTFKVNGSASALTATIADLATTARDITHSASITAGQKVTITALGAGTPTLSAVTIIAEFEPTTAGQSGYGFNAGSAPINTTAWSGVFTGQSFGGVSGIAVQNVVAVAGNITSMSLYCQIAPGASASHNCFIYKNGVKQDGSGGTVNTGTTVTGAGVLTGTSTFTLPVAAGDTVYIEDVPAGTPFSITLGASIGFAATDTSKFQFSGATLNAGGTSGSDYANGAQKTNAWDTTEANVSFFTGGVRKFDLTGWYVALDVAPGAAKSHTYTGRIASATPGNAPVVVISGTTTPAIGTDASGRIRLTDGDKLTIQNTSAGTPAAARAAWAAGGAVVGNAKNTGKGSGHKGGGGVVIIQPGGATLLQLGNPGVTYET